MKYRLTQLVLMSLSLWFAGCCSCPKQTQPDDVAEQALTSAPDEDEPQQRAANAPPSVDSELVPIGTSPVLGEDSAVVTVVAFSGYQCPYSKRGSTILEELHKKYPDKVRVVLKHYPIPGHKQSEPAARAAIAAGNQGKFWQMHDILFEHQKQIKSHANDFEDWVAGLATQIGLDVAQFRADFNAPETAKIVERDLALGQEVNVRGTPHFFVNGERVKGVRPLEAFETIVEEQLEQANEMLAREDVDHENVYRKMVAENFDRPDEPKRKPNKPNRPKGPAVEMVPVSDDDPMRGNTTDPLVTIVEFGDLQCRFCKKASSTLDKVEKEYGDKVRIVFKQLPLGMHRQAKPAAKAALAAHQQGKFWEMHDLLFEKQSQMKSNSDDFKTWASGLAKELGLDVDQFEEDFDDPEIAKKIEKDRKLASDVGARGTPNFWINGLNLRGAQSYSSFEQRIDEQIQKAEQLQADKDLAGDKLYEAVVAANKKDPPGPIGKQKPTPKKPDPKVDVSKLTLDDAPLKGDADAPVTIIVFADFQCPYSRRGIANLMEAADRFGGDVSIRFKHYLLPFHRQAKDAAKAAMAAGEQDKFWQMHDLLFDNQKRFDEDGTFVELAEELDLDIDPFKEDMANAEYDKVIDKDMKEGQKVGVRGTPAFIINGTRIVGAQPTQKFEQAIENALE